MKKFVMFVASMAIIFGLGYKAFEIESATEVSRLKAEKADLEALNKAVLDKNADLSKRMTTNEVAQAKAKDDLRATLVQMLPDKKDVIEGAFRLKAEEVKPAAQPVEPKK